MTDFPMFYPPTALGVLSPPPVPSHINTDISSSLPQILFLPHIVGNAVDDGGILVLLSIIHSLLVFQDPIDLS